MTLIEAMPYKETYGIATPYGTYRSCFYTGTYRSCDYKDILIDTQVYQ